jgi:hypothetical protein
MHAMNPLLGFHPCCSVPREAGTIADHYELVGYRPEVTGWCELLAVSDFLERIEDCQEMHYPPPEWQGFDRYELVEPGQRREADTIELPTTRKLFIGGCDFLSWAQQYRDTKDEPQPLKCWEFAR